jgi:geranylgeranyl pyrophosphate synthase
MDEVPEGSIMEAEPRPSLGAGPPREAVDAAVARRLEGVLAEVGASLREVARAALSCEGRPLSPRPRTLWAQVPARVCAAAGVSWQRAVWPGVAMELAMAAADLFDDLADGERIEILATFGPGRLLTTAAGMLALAGQVCVRATEDGASAGAAAEIADLLGRGLAAAADGQMRGLETPVEAARRDTGLAYELAVAKSGPLGELNARLGAHIAVADPDLRDLYGTFGWHFAVYSQLLNDGRAVLPGRPLAKSDVRAGAPTLPLVFAGSHGVPTGLGSDEVATWEEDERRRVVASGGLLATELAAIAERVRAEDALDALAARGQAIEDLQGLIVAPRSYSC